MTLNQNVRDFIFENVKHHPRDIAKTIVQEFDVSRQTANNYLRHLIDENYLTASGKTRARTYALNNYIYDGFEIPVTPALQEDEVWRDKVLPLLADFPKNVVDICQYGFTEMLNNVIDHSESEKVFIIVAVNALTIRLGIHDSGVGIFNKIKHEFGLSDPRYAILELSKGKLTTDNTRHSGEGVFFTSRVFDDFYIFSGNLNFKTSMDNEDWLFDSEETEETVHGTIVSLRISPRSQRTVKEVFDHYQDDDYRFSKTHVPVRLAKYEGEELVSRSQARRLASRFERFAEVVLDFRAVNTIGQAFADELFRVFQNAHPDIHMTQMHANAEVLGMIQRVLNRETETSAQAS